MPDRPAELHAGGIPTARRFDAARFVLATAASIHDDTALVDEIAALQDEYRDDLDIQVVGIEHLSVKLRDAAAIVAAFFGRDWPGPSAAWDHLSPRPCRQPVSGCWKARSPALNLEAAAAHAEGLRETQPAVAAEAHRAIADQLQASGYPGHAEIFRHRAGEDLLRAATRTGASTCSGSLASTACSAATPTPTTRTRQLDTAAARRGDGRPN